MKHYKVIIADDEELTRERLSDLLALHPQFQIAAKASNGQEAIQLINQHQPDILFLDIKMPIASGFDVLEKLSITPAPVLVFVTAYDHYAVKAFEKEAFDYLLKPFSRTRFEKVLHRIKLKLESSANTVIDYLLVKEKGETIKLESDKILYIESSNNNVILHLEKQFYKKRTTLSNMVQNLNGAIFLRVHRSFILNINHISKMRHVYHGDYLFTMSNGKILPSSKTYRNNVDRILNK